MALLHPLSIGSVTLKHNIIFGPMAGVSDLPFRLLCHEAGASLGVTELISAKAITYRNRNTIAMLERDPGEGPLAVQLFGSEPEVFAEAVGMICGTRQSGAFACSFDILDINMGCPVPKVVSNGEGSALMKKPQLIEQIVRACAGQTGGFPVTVKLRSGFDAFRVNAAECALAAVQGGASAVTVHARTRDMMYSGSADWKVIRAVREAVSVPVIGNGDITDGASAKRMLEETGCDGVMIARAAQGNPWVFREVAAYLETGEVLPRPSLPEIRSVMERHFALLCEHKGEYTAVREMRRHIGWYVSGMPGSARLKEAVNRTESAEDLHRLVADFFAFSSH